jgi:hypothetical protein
MLKARPHDEMAADADVLVRAERSIVAALCMCVLGECEDAIAGAWPPQSLAELSHRAGGVTHGATGRSTLLEQGLDALDDLALRETGSSFSRLDRRTQLRSLFEFEAGLGRLSRGRASAFIDAFLTLAAQAYLCDALEGMPP